MREGERKKGVGFQVSFDGFLALSALFAESSHGSVQIEWEIKKMQGEPSARTQPLYFGRDSI